MSEYEEAKAKYIDESLLVTDRACPEYARRNIENATAMYQAADAELARLREVLDKIANPVLALQEEAQEFGAKIDAVEAIRMTQNPSWYRTTARKALKSRDS